MQVERGHRNAKEAWKKAATRKANEAGERERSVNEVIREARKDVEERKVIFSERLQRKKEMCEYYERCYKREREEKRRIEEQWRWDEEEKQRKREKQKAKEKEEERRRKKKYEASYEGICDRLEAQHYGLF